MFITKMALPRRTFLRGMGVTMALPLLDAMVPAASALAQTAAKPVRRLGFVYIPNGAVMRSWQPAGDGTTLTEMPRTLSPLEPFADQVILPIGLSQKQAEALGDGNGEHSRAGTVWLSGVHPKETEGADVRNGTTADQIAARYIGGDTPLTSLELAMEQTYLIGNCDNGYSCVYTNSISWRTPTTPNPHETNPRVVFQRMFGDGGTPEQRLAQLHEDRSILDWVTADITRLQKQLGAADRTSVNEYLDSVREIERRIQVSERQHGESTLELPDRPIGVPESYDAHAKLMFDLLAVAFKADITRVFVFTLGKEQTNRAYPELGVNAAHHSVSHHQHDPVKFEQGAKVNQYHIGLTAHFLETLKATPDGDGTLLDHSLVLHGGGISDANEHSHIDLPLVLVGGAGGVTGGSHSPAPERHPDEQSPCGDARARRCAYRHIRRCHGHAPARTARWRVSAKRTWVASVPLAFRPAWQGGSLARKATNLEAHAGWMLRERPDGVHCVRPSGGGAGRSGWTPDRQGGKTRFRPADPRLLVEPACQEAGDSQVGRATGQMAATPGRPAARFPL